MVQYKIGIAADVGWMSLRESIGYDIIGDVHGHLDALEALLGMLGYAHDGRSYCHPSRKAIFVGDLIDRGPKIRETLGLVKAMHDHGQALVILGNHEYNAVCYFSCSNEGEWLRPHSTKNQSQLQATIDAFDGIPEDWDTYLAWLRKLPLYLEMDGFRVVHACWSQQHINVIGSRTLEDRAFLDAASTPGSPEFRAVEMILNGPELALPDGLFITDTEGVTRDKIRVKWWMELAGATYQSIAFPADRIIPTLSIPETVAQNCTWDVYPPDGRPVFVGHYCLPPRSPRPWQSIACLDYSVAADGFLAAYRWRPGSDIVAEAFVTSAKRPTVP